MTSIAGIGAAVIGTGFIAAGPWDESSLRDIREDAERGIRRVERDAVLQSCDRRHYAVRHREM